MGQRTVTTEAMDSVEKSLEDAVVEYLSEYRQLEAVVVNVRAGMSGTPVNDFLAKFSEKKSVFDSVERTLNEAADAMAQENSSFKARLESLRASFR